MEIHAKVFYTAEVLGISERINPVVFRAINQDRRPLTAESDIAKLFESSGVLRMISLMPLIFWGGKSLSSQLVRGRQKLRVPQR